MSVVLSEDKKDPWYEGYSAWSWETSKNPYCPYQVDPIKNEEWWRGWLDAKADAEMSL